MKTNQSKSFSVAPSPLNGIKLELGVSLAVGILLLLVVGRFTVDVSTQILVLVSYGVVAMLWLFARTRRVMSRLQKEGKLSESGNGQDKK